MPDPAGQVLHREAEVVASDVGARTLTVRLCRWNDPRPVSDPGRPAYVESWAPGSLEPISAHLYVVDQHQGQLIGRMSTPVDTAAGPVSTLTIARTRAGEDILALVDARVVNHVSLEALEDPAGAAWSPDRRSVHRTHALLQGVSFAFHPAHDAPILARTYGGSPTMPDPTTDPTGTPSTPGAGGGPGPDLDTLLAQLAGTTADAGPGGAGATGPAAGAGAAPAAGTTTLARGSTEDQLRDLIALRTGPGTAPPAAPIPGPGPGMDALRDEVHLMRAAVVELGRRDRGPARYRYETFGALMRGRAAGDVTDAEMVQLNRAIVDITTADVPGLIPRAAIATIMDVISRDQVLADAAGPVPLPDSGMTIDYPKITARPSVGPQAAEKTDVVSVKTHVARATADVLTLAGGEDVSIQAILRSSPSYLEVVGQLYLEAMAIATDLAAYAAYADAAGILASIGADPAAWVTQLFNIQGQVLEGHRALANKLVLSADLWVKVGGAVDTDGRPLFTNTNPVNPAGSVRLTSTEGDIRELAFVVDPNMPADRGAMFDSNAFRAALGPVSTLTSDVPTKLGRDYAVYRFGSFLPIDPLGMALFASGVAPTASGTAAKSARK